MVFSSDELWISERVAVFWRRMESIESITPRLFRVSKVSQHHQKELTRGLLRIKGHAEAESEAEGKVGVLSALTLLP